MEQLLHRDESASARMKRYLSNIRVLNYHFFSHIVQFHLAR